MSRTVKELEADIRCLSRDEKTELLKTLIAELDTPADPNVDQAWVKTSQRRYRQLVEGEVKGVPGPHVFARLGSQLE
jgi:hypothetical protein